MKKIILFLTLVFAFTLSVVASDNIIEKVTLKDIKLTNYEVAPYEGTLEIDYELVPNDVLDKNINWTISGLQKGVVVTFKSGEKTETAVGTMVLEVKNSNEKESTFRVTAKSGKITKTVTVKIENKETTETRYKQEVVKQIETLINEVKNIDDKNVESIEKAVNKIDVMLKNEEVRKSVKKELLDDFNEIKDKLNAFKKESKRDYTKFGLILVLMAAFLFGLYMLFKDNKPKKEVAKPTINKIEPKKTTKKKK